MRVLLLDCEDSYTLNIYDYLMQCDLDVDIVLHQNVVLDEISNYTALVLSPGPKSPSGIPILNEVLKQYAQQLPILGICLGHQAIGMFYGHPLVKSEQPMHGISVKISTVKDPIFHNIDAENFIAMRYNSLAIAEKKDSELEVIAHDETGEIMACKHKTLPIYSFQFHPESIGTPQGLTLFQNWKKVVSKNYNN